MQILKYITTINESIKSVCNQNGNWRTDSSCPNQDNVYGNLLFDDCHCWQPSTKAACLQE